MRSPLLLAALLLAFFKAWAAEPEPACEQLRAQIGMPPLADPDLLRAMAARKDCRFSSAEFYKAAYGDQPPARETGTWRHHRRHDDDDD